MLKAREGIQFNRGEAKSIETLRTKFNSYCPVQNVPYDQNPFYTCVERAGRCPPPSRLSVALIVRRITEKKRHNGDLGKAIREYFDSSEFSCKLSSVALK